MPGRDKQVDRVKPHAQRRPRILKNRARARMHVEAAMSASVCGAISETMKGRNLAALVAEMPQPVANCHQMLEAAFLSREPLKELANREGLNVAGFRRRFAMARRAGHWYLLCPEYRLISYGRQ